jgi:hypothetical protein
VGGSIVDWWEWGMARWEMVGFEPARRGCGRRWD